MVRALAPGVRSLAIRGVIYIPLVASAIAVVGVSKFARGAHDCTTKVNEPGR
jgi:hypothetical protein